jgi:teichuronic acid biosynthesis glycosyltransferase TuaC
MTLKVLQLTNMYPTATRPYFGVFVKRQVDAVRASGIETEVFFTDASFGRRRYLNAIPCLRRALRDQRFDLIHAHHSYCALQARAAELGTRRIPLVLTLHEGEVYAGLRGALRERVHPLRALTYTRGPKRLALGLADLRVSVEAGLPGEVGYAGSVEVIAPGTDMDLFRPLDPALCRRQLDLPADRPIVLFPADPGDRNKGGDLVRESLSRVEGDPMLVSGGRIPPARMPTYINASDVVVQASAYEAAPAVIREAMACGVPIVSTPAGDVERLLGDTSGCFVARREPEDLARCIDAALSAPRFPDEGRSRLRELGMTLDDTTARYLVLYRELAGTT